MDKSRKASSLGPIGLMVPPTATEKRGEGRLGQKVGRR